MDFTFINELSKTIESTNIFKYTFTGSKVLAIGLLSFRILEIFVKDFDNKEPKIGNLISIFGYGLLIMSSDWIITSIDDIFSSVNVSISKTESNLFNQLNNMVITKFNKIFEGAEDWLDYIGAVFSSLLVIVMLIFTWIIGALCKLADLSMTAGYLIQRIFILKLLQFLFPLAVALSTYSGTAKLFHTWILRYIGIFILGIAYIGIIHITNLIPNLVVNQFDIGGGNYGAMGNTIDGGIFGIGILVAMVVTFTVKMKLFSSVTSYIMGMFQ